MWGITTNKTFRIIHNYGNVLCRRVDSDWQLKSCMLHLLNLINSWLCPFKLIRPHADIFTVWWSLPNIQNYSFIPFLQITQSPSLDHQGFECPNGGILLKTNTRSGLQKDLKSAIYDTFCLLSYLSCYVVALKGFTNKFYKWPVVQNVPNGTIFHFKGLGHVSFTKSVVL